MPLTATTFRLALTPHRIVMAAVYAGAIAAGWALLPGDNERIAMLERDGHSREALAILEEHYAGGDRSYRTLLQMQAMYEREGNVGKAGDLLEVMARDRPRDAGLQRRLAQFYRSTQYEAGYLTALRSQIAIRYSETACRDLASRLRLNGDERSELSALQNCRQKGYRRPDDLARLAELLAEGGDTAQAVAILRPIDDLKRLKSTRERYLLATLLLEQDQPKEAERRAVRWIRAGKDDTNFAVGLIDTLARSKHPESAIEVAKDAGSPGDAISLTIAERLIEQTQLGPARLYLKGWLDRAVLTDTETALRFAEAALSVDDATTAYAGLGAFGLSRVPAATLSRLAVALDKAGQIGDAAEVRTVAARAADRHDGVTEPAVAAGGNTNGPKTKSTTAASRPLRAEPRKPAQRALATDPLESWRRGLSSKMSDDAQRRLQALAVGPPPPVATVDRRDSRSLSRESRPELRGTNAKVLKKASKVLQRAKKNQVLKAARKRPAEPQSPAQSPAQANPAKPAAQSPGTAPLSKKSTPPSKAP